jgi:hypothetical protein
MRAPPQAPRWLVAPLLLALACSGGGGGNPDAGPDGGTGCRLSEKLCGTECVDIHFDRNHCGACGNVCSATQTCQAGTCAAPCGGKAGFAAVKTLALASAPSTLLAGELTRDDRIDLALAGDSLGLVVYKQVLDGGFEVAASVASGATPRALVATDFNTDGFPELAVSNGSANQVTIFLSAEDGGILPGVATGLGRAADSLGVADMDGDGNSDLVYGTIATQSLGILRGKGDGTFADGGVFAATGGPQDLAVTYFDDDAFPDIGTVSGSSANLTIFPGLEDGGVGTPKTTAATLSSPLALATTDVDDNGLPDLLVANGNNTVAVLIGKGDGTFTLGTPVSVSGAITAMVSADLSADNLPDLAVGIGTQVHVFYGTGNGVFTGATPYAAGGTVVKMVAEDLNLDGRYELVVATTAANGVGLLYNTCE